MTKKSLQYTCRLPAPCGGGVGLQTDNISTRTLFWRVSVYYMSSLIRINKKTHFELNEEVRGGGCKFTPFLELNEK